MLDKIVINGKSLRGLIKVYPALLCLYRAFALLQEDHVADNLRSGIGAEGVIRQTDCADQLCALRNIPPHLRRFLVHGITTCEESNDSAGTHLLQRFREKVIMNREPQLLESRVIDLILPKRHIANSNIKKIMAAGRFKPRRRDFCRWV